MISFVELLMSYRKTKKPLSYIQKAMLTKSNEIKQLIHFCRAKNSSHIKTKPSRFKTILESDSKVMRLVYPDD